jgi:excisionase family DNA binding protein
METLTVSEAAGRLGVNHKVIRRLISQGHVDASLRMGRHGPEWRIDAASLESYRERAYGDAPVAGAVSASARPAPATAQMLEELREDKRFLREQVDRLTSILQNGGTPDAASPGRPEPASGAVTGSLQQALRLAGPEHIASMEFVAPRASHDHAMLWRTAARNPADIAALIGAVLSDTAQWDPPANECLFVFARDATGGVLWGAACGPGWFGPAFIEALRRARVERL